MGFYFCIMSNLLFIETSSKNCSVGISRDGVLLAVQEQNKSSFSHAEKLHLFIHSAIKQADLKREELQGVVVGKGPGSYTGLRIGVAAAKGLCYALDIPLLSVSSLEALAQAAGDVAPRDSYIIPQIDARRMEVYTAVYDPLGNVVQDPWAAVLDSHAYASYLDKKVCCFLGDGQDKWKSISQHQNALFLNDIRLPSIQQMIELGTQKFNRQAFEDLAYFEPFYLKEFYTTPPKS